MISPSILSCERSPRFWTDLVFATNAEMQRDSKNFRTAYGFTSESHPIDWSLPEGFKVRLQLTAALEAELFLVTPEGESLTLGWDDQAHWHPHVLRRDELERICRAMALTSPSDPNARHPGWPIRLLDRFAPVCDADDINAAYATLFAAHREQSGLDDKTILQLVQRSDCRGNGFVWEETEEFGWVIDQTDDEASRSLYSLRQPPVTRSAEQQEIMEEMRERGLLGPEHQFPFQQWNACLDAIDRTLEQLRVIGDQSDDAKMFAQSGDDETLRLFNHTIESVGLKELAAAARDHRAAAYWIAEQALGCDTGMLVTACTKPFSIPMVRSLSVHYGIPDQPGGSESPLFSKLFVAGLDAMLRDLQVGSADHMSSGSKKTKDGKEVSTGQSDTIRTVLTDGQIVDLVRRWFVYGGGPLSGTHDQPRPTLTRKSFSDPLDDDLHHMPIGEFVFNLTRLRTDQYRWGFALRRVVVSDPVRNEIAKTLTEAGFRVALRPEANGGDGLTIRIGNIDSVASEILWQVMSQHELLLLPHLIASSPKAAEQVQRHPENVTIVDTPKDLGEALQCRRGNSNRTEKESR